MGLLNKFSNKDRSITPEKQKQNAALEKAFEDDMPDAAFVKARNQYFDSIGQPVVDKSRLFVLSISLVVVVILLLIALILLLPLKTTEPYVVYIDSSKGLVTKDIGTVSRASEYNPERPVIERELYQFVEKLYAMNADYPKIVKDGHTQAYSYVRGRAIEEFRSYIANEQTYQRQKTTLGLYRTTEKKTISFREDGKLVLIRFKTLEKSLERPVPVARDWLITLQFERKQPSTKPELDMNPLGIYITHFEIIEER